MSAFDQRVLSTSRLLTGSRKRPREDSAQAARTVWDWEWDAEEAERLCLSQDQRAIWAGPSDVVVCYPFVEIRKSCFRVESHDQRRRTQDSGVAAVFTVGDTSARSYGVLEKVLQVRLGPLAKVLLRVRWFKRSQPNPRLSGGVHVVSGGRQPHCSPLESMIEAGQVTAQVFFASDPDHSHLQHVFQVQRSSYRVPDHLLDDDGRLLDV